MSLSKTLGKSLTLSPERQEEADADMTIVRRVWAGEVGAFDTLVHKYRERLYGVVYNLTGNREDAAELTQDTFIKAFQAIGRFKGNASVFSWLYRIGINSTITHLRSRRLQRFFSLEKLAEDGHSLEVVQTLVERSSIERETLVRELQEKLNEALQKLSIKHRTVVTLFEIDQLSHQEIAEIMGCSVGTVRSRLHYAKEQLQGYLQEYLK